MFKFYSLNDKQKCYINVFSLKNIHRNLLLKLYLWDLVCKYLYNDINLKQKIMAYWEKEYLKQIMLWNFCI